MRCDISFYGAKASTDNAAFETEFRRFRSLFRSIQNQNIEDYPRCLSKWVTKCQKRRARGRILLRHNKTEQSNCNVFVRGVVICCL